MKEIYNTTGKLHRPLKNQAIMSRVTKLKRGFTGAPLARRRVVVGSRKSRLTESEAKLGSVTNPYELHPKQQLRITRATRFGTGFAWEIAVSPNLEVVRKIEASPESVGAAQGGEGTLTWVVRAKEAGQGLVYLVFKRSWEPDSRSDRQERIHITVS